MTSLTKPRSASSWALAASIGAWVLMGAACDAPSSHVYAHTAREYELTAVVDDAKVHITVVPRAPWRMNLIYPRASSVSEGGHDLPATTESASDERFVFVHARPARALDQSGQLLACRTRFAVCIDDLCKPMDHAFEIPAR